jgi:DNA-binding transcriptional LysR family regulator
MEDLAMDQLAALKLFVQVGSLKSISAAGRSLGLSTTAASKRLQDLEAALRVKLVDRTTRQLALTEAGQRLFARSVALLGELDSAFSEARELQDAPVGTLRIVARRSFGMLHVAPALPAFRAAYPLIAIDIEFTEETELTPGRGIDLVIRLGAPNDKSIVTHQLTTAGRKLCASPKYLARAGAPRTPADLAHHDCLTYRRASEPAIWTFRGRRGEVSQRVTGSLQSNSGEVLRSAAIEGFGLVLLPEWMVARDLANGNLEGCLESYEAYPPPYREPIYAVHRRGPVPAKIPAFVAHLNRALGTAQLSRKSGK